MHPIKLHLFLLAALLFIACTPVEHEEIATQNLILINDAGEFASVEEVGKDFEYAFPEVTYADIYSPSTGLLTFNYSLPEGDTRNHLSFDDPKGYFKAAYTFGELKYLLQGDTGSPSTLTLRSDNTFSLDFNLCHFMAEGTGTYLATGDTLSLDVTECTNCDNNEYNSSVGLDYGLPTADFDLKAISGTEWEVQGDVMRTENGQAYGFCAPSTEYKIFQLISE